ncbi:hypothetical protein DGo_PC0093 (plasmid) [Deinococcus gobiensis I-0]|uniref:Uncharacterized protein n=1 Tax=Deinococcus gobiensis (strain DSM 21396 / JCM 16679 / CGMCC 1.7299 / I-0) TaxID=745776 RepID=H8H2Y8_DEIGI|nr:hypothetical protein DGo_PC0093 [Deinococcus gobiensis I-0]
MIKVYARATHLQTNVPTRLLGPFETEQEAWAAVAQCEGQPLSWERTKRGSMVSTPHTRWLTESVEASSGLEREDGD